jgi:hypothetical protein
VDAGFLVRKRDRQEGTRSLHRFYQTVKRPGSIA